MKKQCQLTGKRRIIVNNVSHSKRRTKSYSNPNVIWKNLPLDVVNSNERLRIATQTLKTINYNQGLFNFLLLKRNNQLNKMINSNDHRKDAAKTVKKLKKKAIYHLLNNDESELTTFELELKQKFLKSRSGRKVSSKECRPMCHKLRATVEQILKK